LHVLTGHTKSGYAAQKAQGPLLRELNLSTFALNGLGGRPGVKKLRKGSWTDENIQAAARKKSAENSAKGGAKNSQTLF
jgi:hypothetical protein